MWLVYGIVAAQDLPCFGADEPAPGLHWIEVAGLAALARETTPPLPRDPASVLAYGEIVARCHERVTVIPLRYGSTLPAREEIAQRLEAKAPTYRALLEALAGCVEMGVRWVLPALPAAGAEVADGRAYLRARQRALAPERQVLREAAALDEALAGLYRQRRAEQGWLAGRRTYAVDYLVERAASEAFRARAQGFAAAGEGRMRVSGPWPPYGFAAPGGIKEEKIP